MKPIVYIASPYTKGDPCINTQFQCRIFHELMNDKIVYPLVPLWSHFQHTMYPRDYKDWIEYDLALITKCDACLRLNANIKELNYFVSESKGADGEVQAFLDAGKPVFYSVHELYKFYAKE